MCNFFFYFQGVFIFFYYYQFVSNNTNDFLPHYYNPQIDLNSQIIILKNELKNKNQIINNLQNELINLKNSFNIKLSLIDQLQNNLNQKEKELSQIKNNLLSNSNRFNTYSGNKYGFGITFRSINQDFIYPIVCNQKESISRLEEELYNEFPKYKEFNIIMNRIKSNKK